jgi:hypothetical protein
MSDLGPFSPHATAAAALGRSRARLATCAVAGVTTTGFFILPARPVGAAIAGALLFGAALGPRDRSGADYLARAASFWARSRWTKVSMTANAQRYNISARGRSEVDLYEFVHRGRLDLSGDDRTLDADIAGLLERVAGEGGGTVTWHLSTRSNCSTSTLAVPAGTRPTRSFMSTDADKVDFSGPWILERWRYLRSAHEVLATFAVESSRAHPTEPVLRALMSFASDRDATVAIHVMAASRANSVVGRHSHRWRANVALANLGGFRQRASTDSATHLLDEREREVAQGRALCQVDIFITLRAPTRRQLEVAALALREDARRAATRLERGNGRHALWFCSQLPGSPASAGS